ncbi:MAG: hypothetical protein KC897_00170 [Candidatus Omnitrophica bacterium]|nr:hypothetical protein [Candidatus Omnitrophota bacterium]MCB9722010.1 hypothetical protein [Candidatus Omnitrophota bacterium]
MLLLICQKCGYQKQEPGLLSQKSWVWPLFALFPAMFISYYGWSLCRSWPQLLRIGTVAVLFAAVVIGASLFLREYCRSMEFEHFRRGRCPECQHTQWKCKEIRTKRKDI